LVIGEGAATLILEEMERAKARGATIIAEVVGFFTNTDGAHVTQPSSETMAACMNGALDNSKISANSIGYISAHGTATRYGDIAESIATEAVFGNKTPISSLKSYIGHSLGACGAIESILSIMMMNNDIYAPNINLMTIDPDCAQLNYIVNSCSEFSSEFIISNNFAFGGINTSLIFRRM
jgi:3-oxoacyl-[acyl-carrier-protein] synthase II